MRHSVLLSAALLGALLLCSGCHSEEDDGTGFDVSAAAPGHHHSHYGGSTEDLPDLSTRPDPDLAGFDDPLGGSRHHAAGALDPAGAYSGKTALVLPPPSPSARAHIAPLATSAPYPPFPGALAPRRIRRRP